ncbi:MAG TPA: hypothetical protein VGP16_01680 [Asanoa sp.]|jgi:hypothetical protein|nr:hypothetical protein [Asanoa sp.]
MTDVTDLKDSWAEPDPPSPTAQAAARAALMREITAACALKATPSPTPRRRGGRFGWLAGSTVATAAAVALAVVLTSAQPAPPGQQATRSSPSPDELSGQQILLQAAEVAQTRPESTGTYWHVEQEIPVPDTPKPIQRYNDWAGRDGVHYSMPDGSPGVSRIIMENGFAVGGSLLTLARVEGLPTNPDKLKTWMTDSYLRPNTTPDEMAALVPDGLSRLLWEVPAPPAVRSAALRALATSPNVTNLGAVNGGQALRIFFTPPPADKFPEGKLPPGAGEITVVINQDTATLISFTTYQGTTKILAASWTDNRPEIIPLH